VRVILLISIFVQSLYQISDEVTFQLGRKKRSNRLIKMIYTCAAPLRSYIIYTPTCRIEYSQHAVYYRQCRYNTYNISSNQSIAASRRIIIYRRKMDGSYNDKYYPFSLSQFCELIL